MIHHEDVQLTEFENRLLQEEKFELGYRLGVAEGLAAALEAISEISFDDDPVVNKRVIERLRAIKTSSFRRE